jgi:hypothetical protein
VKLQSIAILILAAWLVAGCCSGGCPTSPKAPERAAWEAELQNREPLPLNPRDEIAIKRDVHNIFVSADAATFADAFHQVMQDPARRYGLIRVDRLKQNVGQPFSIGEKFQGRYSIEGAVRKELRGKWEKLFGKLVDDEAIQGWLCRIENEHTSDYGIIARLEMSPEPGRPYVLQYRYLQGSPIAGSSTFIVTDVLDPDVLARLGVPHAARLTQVFEYQEQTKSFAEFFTKGGLKLHNQVVYSQAKQSADLAGAAILESDIPEEYAAL